jgi:hypothetical protein
MPDGTAPMIDVPPTAPGEWSIAQIEYALSRPLPAQLLKQKKKGGNTLDYLPWYRAVKILNKYAPGWGSEVRSMQQIGDNLCLSVALSIPTSSGIVTREATGIESLNCSSFGDPASNAQSMALRRAAAQFGLGLHLYEKAK